MRARVTIGLAAVAALMASAASAGHDLAFAFTLSDPSPGANSDFTASLDFGDEHPSGLMSTSRASTSPTRTGAA